MTGFPAKAKGLSFVTPVAYDHRYAWAAIASYYGIADEIILGLDRDRISWSGKYFHFDEDEFRRRLSEADPLRKVTLVEGDFHSQATPMANDTHERNQLALRCNPAHWVVQIDSDELLQNPGDFRDWLLQRRGPWLIMGRWTIVYKCVGDDYLVIDKRDTWISLATRRRGRYTGSRDTSEFRRRSPLHMFHFAWGRGEDELRQKLESWSHAHDFDTAKALAFWKSVDRGNYSRVRDFHPFNGPDWPSLRLIRKGDPDWVAPPL